MIVKTNEDDRTRDRPQSPVIYRCARCGALVHPSSGTSGATTAWCMGCKRYVEVVEDGPGRRGIG
jgi:DNA-directed RNA polymerase subunit RPC12/RpoP